MNPTRAEQAQQTRARILAVALRLFAERGYDATSLQDIADEMDLTKAAVYYHYPAKTDLLHGVCAPVYAAMTEVIDRAAALRGRHARIEALATGFVDMMLSRREVIAILAGDPVTHGRAKAASSMPELLDRAVHVVYGDDPTPDQRLAVHGVMALGDSISALPELSDDELRAVLLRAVNRLLVTNRAGGSPTRGTAGPSPAR